MNLFPSSSVFGPTGFDDLSISIRLQNDLVVVRPPRSNDPEDVDSGLGTTLSGRIIIAGQPWLTIVDIRLAIVTTASTFDHGERSSIIYEKYQDIDMTTLEVRVHDDGKRLRYGAEFDVVLPPTLATHEITKSHEVISRIWVTVVTKINSTTHKGKPLTNARIIELDELTTVKRGKVQDVESATRLRTARWNGSDARIRSIRSPPIPPTRLLSNGTSASRIFAVVAEPQSEDASHLLHSVRDGRVEGLGIWKSELRSGWLAVGGYVIPSLTLTATTPGVNVFAVRLELVQTPWTMPIADYNLVGIHGQWIQGEEQVVALVSEGRLPPKARLEADWPAMWRSDRQVDQSWHWSPGKTRLSDDTHVRSSTVESTNTPLRLRHRLRFKLFFSVDGRDVEGREIAGSDEMGALRMLVIEQSIFLLSCCCTMERITLPNYGAEAAGMASFERVPHCTCCYDMQDLPDAPHPSVEASTVVAPKTIV